VEKILRVFPDKGVHLALVKDEQGGVADLLTMEDLLEEIIGAVHDEFDDEFDLPKA
jgi:Mg2+/Co2+ transporter CorC